MKTYPIYEAKFLGSSDCMCAVNVRVAARNKRDAAKKLLAIQNARSNTIGPIGRWSEEYKTNVRDETAISIVKETRSTKLDHVEYKYL